MRGVVAVQRVVIDVAVAVVVVVESEIVAVGSDGVSFGFCASFVPDLGLDTRLSILSRRNSHKTRRSRSQYIAVVLEVSTLGTV